MGDLVVPKCPNCGAQLPVGATDTTVQCAYCGRRSAVRRPGFGAPPPFAAGPAPAPFQPAPPPPPFGQPYGAPAPLAPGPVPARTGSGGAMLVVLIAALGVLIAGAVAAVIAAKSGGAHHGPASDQDDLAETAPVSTGADRGQRPSSGAEATKPAQANLFEKPAAISAALATTLGKTVKLKQIVVHKHHAVVEAEEATGKLARYHFSGGALKAFGTPHLTDRDRRQLDKLLFTLDRLDLTMLPRLSSQALKRLGWQGAEISHVIVQHGSPFANKFLIRVYVKSATESGRVEYDFQGREHRVYR